MGSGTEHADAIERLAQKRALELYDLDPAQWGVNVQPCSGSPSNTYAFWGALPKGSRVMGLNKTHGGHFSHGFQTPVHKSATVDY